MCSVALGLPQTWAASHIYVASQGTPGALDVPYQRNYMIYSHFRPFLRRHTSDTLSLKHVILFVDVTSFNDTVTSQHHTCIGQVTIYYKKSQQQCCPYLSGTLGRSCS